MMQTIHPCADGARDRNHDRQRLTAMAASKSEIVYAEDRRLAKRVLAGDEDAFQLFFDDNYSRLYRFALGRMNGDEAAAEDIVQQCFSKALRKLASYKAESQLHTWLCAICRNDIADWYRKQGRYEQRIVLAEDLPGLRAAMDSFRAPADEDPARQFQRLEASRLIQVALDRLPSKYGNALEWKYVEGYSSREVAGRLEIGYEAAQSLLARAKRAFAEVYSELTDAALNPGAPR
jgi:RNA polymerase sigma-70 factor, ECF subfamily